LSIIFLFGERIANVKIFAVFIKNNDERKQERDKKPRPFCEKREKEKYVKNEFL